MKECAAIIKLISIKMYSFKYPFWSVVNFMSILYHFKLYHEKAVFMKTVFLIIVPQPS